MIFRFGVDVIALCGARTRHGIIGLYFHYSRPLARRGGRRCCGSMRRLDATRRVRTFCLSTKLVLGHLGLGSSTKLPPFPPTSVHETIRELPTISHVRKKIRLFLGIWSREQGPEFPERFSGFSSKCKVSHFGVYCIAAMQIEKYCGRSDSNAGGMESIDMHRSKTKNVYRSIWTSQHLYDRQIIKTAWFFGSMSIRLTGIDRQPWNDWQTSELTIRSVSRSTNPRIDWKTRESIELCRWNQCRLDQRIMSIGSIFDWRMSIKSTKVFLIICQSNRSRSVDVPSIHTLLQMRADTIILETPQRALQSTHRV